MAEEKKLKIKVKFSKIKWEKDGVRIKLPSTLILEVAHDVDLELEGADILSDEVGWLVNSFEFEKLTMTNIGVDIK